MKTPLPPVKRHTTTEHSKCRFRMWEVREIATIEVRPCLRRTWPCRERETSPEIGTPHCTQEVESVAERVAAHPPLGVLQQEGRTDKDRKTRKTFTVTEGGRQSKDFDPYLSCPLVEAPPKGDEQRP